MTVEPFVQHNPKTIPNSNLAAEKLIFKLVVLKRKTHELVDDELPAALLNDKTCNKHIVYSFNDNYFHSKINEW